MPSFDVVSEVNQVEVRNAVDQTNKEVSTRFDFKGSDARVELADKTLTIHADDEFKLKQVTDILTAKFAKRGVDTRCLRTRPPASHRHVLHEDEHQKSFVDEWGIRWQMPKSGGPYFDIGEFPLSGCTSVGEVERYRWPDPDRDYANGAFIPGAADYPPRWVAKAAAFRAAMGARARLDLAYGAAHLVFVPFRQLVIAVGIDVDKIAHRINLSGVDAAVGLENDLTGINLLREGYVLLVAHLA